MIDINDILISDPRVSDWREVVKTAIPHIVPAIDSLRSDESPISELMNLARSQHEITDDFLPEVFDWFTKHGERKQSS